MDTKPVCPSCGKPLETSAPKGLCPECLMKGAFPTGTDTGGNPVRFVPPKIEELAAKFPQLELLEFIGQGGMGAVYKARQKQLDRIVALKILPPQAATGPGFAERFAHEARALAKLNHPHIVTLYEFGQADGLFYFLMEFVDGLTLGQLLRDRRLAPKEALAIVPQICDALQYAHEHGIVHRDIKPENILLSKEGQVKIADFGVAKIVAQGLEEAAGTAPTPAGELTQAGSALGTPQYMAPEQIKNSAEVDHRADIYSLGVVFYQMLTGELPEGKIEPPSKKVQVDVRLDEVVLRALEKKPEMRYQEASVLKTQVESIAQTPGASPDVESFAQAVMARDYPLNVSSCLNRGWNLLISDFWPIIGVCGLSWLISRVANSSIVGIIIGAPLAGGLWMYFLNRIRSLPANLETAFSGFKIAFLQLVLAGLVTKVLTLLGLLCLVIPAIYLWVVWMFTLPLVVDKGLDFWPAMETSRKIISRRWWQFFGFFILLLLIRLAGVACCYVGMFVAMPLCLAALAYAYEDIVGPIPAVPANASAASAGAASARAGSGSGTAIGVVAGVTAAVMGLAILGLLAAIAIPNFVQARHRAMHIREQQHAEWMHRQQLLLERDTKESERKWQQAVEMKAANEDIQPTVKSDYVGQMNFPYGDTIEITSVERSSDEMVVRGHYNLVSVDRAKLALFITTTNPATGPVESEQEANISKGAGEFTLIHPHVVPGMPHVNMYPTNGGGPFAELYFGTKDEAGEESKLHLTHSQETAFEQDAKESERKWQAIMNMKAADEMIRPTVKSDYIGQANFPRGDSIQISSVERSSNEIVVRGHYNLASVDRAKLALFITTTNPASGPFESEQEADISKGPGDFTLIHPHVVPGLPHLNMYPTNGGHPFAELYFGTRAEAQEESHMNLRSPSGSQQEICVDNLRLIDAAKQQWALENKKTRADVPTWTDLVPYLSPDFGNTNVLRCPSGGIYSVGAMSNQPTCSIPGHALP